MRESSTSGPSPSDKVRHTVLYVAPMAYGENPTVDAVAHGLQSRLAEHEIELRVIFAEFRSPDWPASANDAFRAGVRAGVSAAVAWLVTPSEPADGIAEARASGIPVVTLERPTFLVDASVVWPNFNHGVYMAQHLAALLEPGAKVGIIGGPPVVDDVELLHGLVYGVHDSGLILANDPWSERHRNVTDVIAGGRAATHRLLDDVDGLDGLIPFNDETMLGALEALRERGRLDEMKIVSRNGTPAAVRAVMDGHSHGTWDIDAPAIGTMLADLVIRKVVQDLPLDGLCLASPIGRMITADNAAHWSPWQERVTYRPLLEGL